MNWKRIQIGSLAVLVLLLVFTVMQRQHLQDWLKLRNYHPPAAVASIVQDTGMTSEAKTLFYVNRPVISRSKEFTRNCPVGGEKTVVLGCYKSGDSGIYVYDVLDPRLSGVEQVTSAHEMLHAGYERLSHKQREHIDSLLQGYYRNGLKDARIKEVIEAYKQSEPRDVVNEMHSIFGTEVASLPSELETYYKQYFSDRSKVVAMTARYQNEFTSREKQVAEYDVQLKELKAGIETSEAQLDSARAALDAQNKEMQSQRDAGQIAAYNQNVNSYNVRVAAYNNLLQDTKAKIARYNEIVTARNNIALEEQQLASELSASNLNG